MPAVGMARFQLVAGVEQLIELERGGDSSAAHRLRQSRGRASRFRLYRDSLRIVPGWFLAK
jgi:hypothetical protein